MPQFPQPVGDGHGHLRVQIAVGNINMSGHRRGPPLRTNICRLGPLWSNDNYSRTPRLTSCYPNAACTDGKADSNAALQNVAVGPNRILSLAGMRCSATFDDL